MTARKGIIFQKKIDVHKKIKKKKKEKEKGTYHVYEPGTVFQLGPRT